MIQEEQQVKITVNDLIYSQCQELGKRMDRLEKNLDTTRQELNQRMDRLEGRMDKLEAKLEKQDEKIERLADKIDDLRRDLNVGTNHYQILIATIAGVFFTVLFFLLK